MRKNPTSCDLVGFFLIFIKKIQLYSKLFTATINDFCIELPPLQYLYMLLINPHKVYKLRNRGERPRTYIQYVK